MEPAAAAAVVPPVPPPPALESALPFSVKFQYCTQAPFYANPHNGSRDQIRQLRGLLMPKVGTNTFQARFKYDGVPGGAANVTYMDGMLRFCEHIGHLVSAAHDLMICIYIYTARQ